MNITVEKLLGKMEEELRQAKNTGDQESLREKIYSIKILCELILDEKQTAPAYHQQPAAAVPQTATVYQQPASFPQHQIMQPQPSVQPSKKLKMDDGGNGDSLFDF